MTMIIPPRYNRLLNVERILCKKTMAPIIQSMTKLSRTSFRLKLIPIQTESKIRTSHRQSGSIWLFAKCNISSLPVVRGIDPVINTKAKVCNLCFRIIFEETRKKLFLRSEEHTSELQSRENLVCRLLLEKKNRMPRSED